MYTCTKCKTPSTKIFVASPTNYLMTSRNTPCLCTLDVATNVVLLKQKVAFKQCFTVPSCVYKAEDFFQKSLKGLPLWYHTFIDR